MSNKNHFNASHGMTGTRIYNVWKHMKQRCLNKNSKRYEDWGGRGIKVCSKWKTFEGFWEDMKDSYLDDLSIERIDNDGDYCLENCRWATRKQQGSNKRNNRILKWNNMEKTLTDWASYIGMNKGTLSSRINKSKWSVEKSLTYEVEGGQFVI